jgi:hypothetical protein
MRALPRPAGRIAALFALLAPAPAHAATPARQATATVQISKPAVVRKLQDLNFADLVVTGAGTAVINPNTDAMTTTGGVIHFSGTPYAAQFNAVSPAKAVVIIRIPRQPITVTRITGTETMRVDNWTLSGDSRRTVAAQEPFAFKVGGTLHVAANQREGTYVGTFDVEIQYP